MALLGWCPLCGVLATSLLQYGEVLPSNLAGVIIPAPPTALLVDHKRLSRACAIVDVVGTWRTIVANSKRMLGRVDEFELVVVVKWTITLGCSCASSKGRRNDDKEELLPQHQKATKNRRI